jgi:LPPG:FO 2-phospho-L-lactate transferase
VIENAAKLGGPTWFRLGDRDLGTHLERTRRIKEGQCLSEITREFCKAWGIKHTVLPMTDQYVRTMVETDEGELEFQEYFVHRRCEPHVKGFWFDGVKTAKPAPGTREAIDKAEAVIICPSNPWVSIDPILQVISPLSSGKGSGVRAFAISPIIGGKAVKGPAAKMYQELGIRPSAVAVANHYRGLLTGFVMDKIDIELAKDLEVQTLVTDTLMKSSEDRRRLAQEVLHWIGAL